MHFFSARLAKLFTLHNILILDFLAMLSFTIFYRRGIEYSRYVFLGLAALYFFKERYALKQLFFLPSFATLLAFLAVAVTGLALNGQPLTNVDEILNWMIAFAAGYFATRFLGEHRPLVLMVIPTTLVCVYILHPLLIGQGLEYLNPTSPVRLERYFSQRPNHLGVICGAAAFTSTCFAVMQRGIRLKALLFFVSGSCLFLLFKTGARASFIATITIYGIALIWYFRHSWKTLAIIGLIFGIGVLAITHSPLKKNRIAKLTRGIEHDISFQQRMLTWTIARENFLKHPWIGNGFDTFDRQYDLGFKYHSKQEDFQKKFPHTIQSTNNAHNIFLHFLAETGVVGLLTMLYFWGTILHTGLRTRDVTAMAIAGMFCIAFIAFQLNMSLYGSQLSTILFGFAGISASIRKGISPLSPLVQKFTNPTSSKCPLP
jgi:O-antigen ligase